MSDRHRAHTPEDPYLPRVDSKEDRRQPEKSPATGHHPTDPAPPEPVEGKDPAAAAFESR